MVDLELGAIFDVDERAQQFRADFVLTAHWNDPRLRDPAAPTVTEYGAEVLDSGQIWDPELVLVNLRGGGAAGSDATVSVHNTGRVVAARRYVAALACPMDVRDFPYDAQTLVWRLRSARYGRAEVRLRAASPEAQANASAVLRRLADPVFELDDYAQAAGAPETGLLRDYSVLTVTVRAKRISTAGRRSLAV